MILQTFRNLLMPALSGFFCLRFGGESESSSSSSSSNTSTATDNRLAIGNGSIGSSTGGIVSLSDMRDQSTSLNVSDSSNRSVTDQSNRSVNNSGNTTTTTTISSIDPGALRTMERAMLGNETVSREAFKFADSVSRTSADLSSGALDQAFAAVQGANAANVSVLDKAFDSISSTLSYQKTADASRDAGFSKLLDLGKSMFDSNVKAVQNAQTLTSQAYQQATAEKAGSLDNKTITMLGIAAAAVFGLMAWRK